MSESDARECVCVCAHGSLRACLNVRSTGCTSVSVHVGVCLCTEGCACAREGGRALGQGALGARAGPTVRHLVTAPGWMGERGLAWGMSGLIQRDSDLLCVRAHKQDTPPGRHCPSCSP